MDPIIANPKSKPAGTLDDGAQRIDLKYKWPDMIFPAGWKSHAGENSGGLGMLPEGATTDGH